MAGFRLGDDVDDYCVKCKRLTTHAILALMELEIAKVRCRSCYGEHEFRNGNVPPSKRELKKQALFNQVLSKTQPGEQKSKK
jgi:hypothetical protein